MGCWFKKHIPKPNPGRSWECFLLPAPVALRGGCGAVRTLVCNRAKGLRVVALHLGQQHGYIGLIRGLGVCAGTQDEPVQGRTEAWPGVLFSAVPQTGCSGKEDRRAYQCGS